MYSTYLIDDSSMENISRSIILLLAFVFWSHFCVDFFDCFTFLLNEQPILNLHAEAARLLVKYPPYFTSGACGHLFYAVPVFAKHADGVYGLICPIQMIPHLSDFRCCIFLLALRKCFCNVNFLQFDWWRCKCLDVCLVTLCLIWPFLSFCSI